MNFDWIEDLEPETVRQLRGVLRDTKIALERSGQARVQIPTVFERDIPFFDRDQPRREMVERAELLKMLKRHGVVKNVDFQLAGGSPFAPEEDALFVEADLAVVSAALKVLQDRINRRFQRKETFAAPPAAAPVPPAPSQPDGFWKKYGDAFIPEFGKRTAWIAAGVVGLLIALGLTCMHLKK